MNNIRPKVIFLDGMGTLFGLKESVGKIYFDFASKFGVKSYPEAINQAFYHCFKKSSPLAFPNTNKEQISEKEFEWWKAIASETFTMIGVRNQFNNFNQFFLELYLYFTTSQPWKVYPDVVKSLKIWQKQGIELGVISNFDTRLYTILELLGLKPYFTTITISTTTGFAKPNPQIFQAALAKHNCKPEQSWHIGDSLKEDYFGAKSLGIKPFLLKRLSAKN
jgi:putative hydrolase of the HAD superfamily